MNKYFSRLFAGCALFTGAIVGVVALAEAREGFYLGAGFANQSVSGGLDGKEAFGSGDGTVAILAGKPGAGSGFAFVVGYGFNPAIGIEYLFATTSHKASHSLVDFDSDMTLSTGLIGLRISHSPADNLELTGRVGFASGVATYDKFTLHGNTVGSTFVYTSTSEAEFTSSGFGFGIGLEYFFDKVGLSANYSALSVDFDKGKGGGVSGELPKRLSATIS